MSILFAIGDVHGCLVPLQTLIAHIQPQTEDSIIFLGDLIDRGGDSKAVLDYVMTLQTQCHVQCILGNHEEMLLAANYDRNMREIWLRHGGQETLESFGLPPNKIGLAQIPQKYIQFFQNMLPFVETEQFIFTHATPAMDIPMAQQDAHSLRWKRFYVAAPNCHISNKIVVCGHTAQLYGKPYVGQGIIVIDTHAYGNNWLTALDTNSLTAHQANASGTHQTLALSFEC